MGFISAAATFIVEVHNTHLSIMTQILSLAGCGDCHCGGIADLGSWNSAGGEDCIVQGSNRAS